MQLMLVVGGMLKKNESFDFEIKQQNKNERKNINCSH
jgi:hypothetical protein